MDARFLLLTPLVACFSVTARYVDMSHVFDEDTLSWPGQKSFKKTILQNSTDQHGHWVQMEVFESGTHAGTHLDAPCHFAEGRWSVEEIPVRRLILPVIVVDISEASMNNSDTCLAISDLEEWEGEYGPIPNGSLMMVRSGWGQFWPFGDLYFGFQNDTSEKHFPGVSAEAAQWIVDNREIYGVGIDTGSVDNGQSQDFMTHRILAEKNIFNLENVANMEELPPVGATLYVGCIKMVGASGAPCRLLAEFPDAETDIEEASRESITPLTTPDSKGNSTEGKQTTLFESIQIQNETQH